MARGKLVTLTAARPVTLTAALSLLLALAPAAAAAQGQVVQEPVFDRPQELSAAFGSELLVARLAALSALSAQTSEEEDLEELVEGLERDLRLFAGSLEAADPELAERLRDAVERIEGAAPGADLGAAAETALEPARGARELLAGELRGDSAFVAALLTLMLTSERGGIGEAYEEAAEGEAGAYAVGWAALARAHELWGELQGEASEAQRFEIDDMLADLDALFPGPVPAESIRRSDPEEAEGATQRMAAFLEELTGASLFPGRDPARTHALVRELVSGGCEAYEGGQLALGQERLAAAAFYYGENLAGTLSMLAPGATEQVSESFAALVPGALGEEEAEGGLEDEDEEAEEAGPLPAAEAAGSCEELLEALEQAGEPLGL